MNAAFPGLSADMYRFFWDIAFHNDPAYFEENRARYKESVQQPLLLLARLLTPAALEADPQFCQRPAYILSRIRRDTRYSKDKSPYRDHAWLSYRYPGVSQGESFVLYAEFERESWGYGMGMYYSNTEAMQRFRARMLAEPARFLSLISEPAFASRLVPQGELYKKPRHFAEDERLLPYINRKSLSFCFSSPDLDKTLRPQLADELTEAFLVMKPVYRFLMGLD